MSGTKGTGHGRKSTGCWMCGKEVRETQGAEGGRGTEHTSRETVGRGRCGRRRQLGQQRWVSPGPGPRLNAGRVPAARCGQARAPSTFPGELSSRLPLQELVPERVHAARLRPVLRRLLGRQLHLPEPQARLLQRQRPRARRRARRPQAHRPARLPAPQLRPRPHDQQLRPGPGRRRRHHHPEPEPHGGRRRGSGSPASLRPADAARARGDLSDWATAREARAPAGTRATLHLFWGVASRGLCQAGTCDRRKGSREPPPACPGEADGPLPSHLLLHCGSAGGLGTPLKKRENGDWKGRKTFHKLCDFLVIFPKDWEL